ncbi:MAG: hypothetical protein MSS24_01660 [Clostridiales bacterium]|jgi:hypothetical protein|nr:hypothetical protein [Clostridiales bacterium]
MRIWTEEQERLRKIIEPWREKDPELELKGAPEEIKKAYDELLELSKKIRLENG